MINNYTPLEKEILSSEMEIYFISGVVGLFTFFELAFCAKGFDSTFIYFLSQVGMFISGILYISSYYQIGDYIDDIFKVKLDEDSRKSKLLYDKEKRNVLGYSIVSIVSVIILIISINGASNLMDKLEVDNLLWPAVCFISTIFSSILLSKMLLSIRISWSKIRILKNRIDLKKHTIVLRKQILKDNKILLSLLK